MSSVVLTHKIHKVSQKISNFILIGSYWQAIIPLQKLYTFMTYMETIWQEILYDIMIQSPNVILILKYF